MTFHEIIADPCLFVFASRAFSQYYFNDIVSTKQSNDQYKLLRANKIKKDHGA